MRSHAFALIALLALTQPAWAQNEEAAQAPVAAPALPAITVTTVAERKIEDHVLASGLIGAVQNVSVPPLIEGQPIESLNADVGDMVQQGQLLATLSTATLALQKSQLLASAASVKATIAQAEAQLLNAQTQADEAQRSADRSATLLAQGSVSKTGNDQAKAALVAAQASVTVAQQSLEAARAQETQMQAQIDNVDLQLSRANIVAPVSGLITARNAQLGAIASAAGQPLFVIMKDGALELAADVAEADIARVAKDQIATLTLASGVTSAKGTVRLVEPTVDVNTRLGRARISLAADPAIRAGMFAEANILVTAHQALAVPVTAVGSADGQSTVMLVKDGVVSRVPVTTGIRQGGWVEVVTGLAAGDTIVAKAGAFVSDGDKINPIPSETN